LLQPPSPGEHEAKLWIDVGVTEPCELHSGKAEVFFLSLQIFIWVIFKARSPNSGEMGLNITSDVNG